MTIMDQHCNSLNTNTVSIGYGTNCDIPESWWIMGKRKSKYLRGIIAYMNE